MTVASLVLRLFAGLLVTSSPGPPTNVWVTEMWCTLLLESLPGQYAVSLFISSRLNRRRVCRAKRLGRDEEVARAEVGRTMLGRLLIMMEDVARLRDRVLPACLLTLALH